MNWKGVFFCRRGGKQLIWMRGFFLTVNIYIFFSKRRKEGKIYLNGSAGKLGTFLAQNIIKGAWRYMCTFLCGRGERGLYIFPVRNSEYFNQETTEIREDCSSRPCSLSCDAPLNWVSSALDSAEIVLFIRWYIQLAAHLGLFGTAHPVGCNQLVSLSLPHSEKSVVKPVNCLSFAYIRVTSRLKSGKIRKSRPKARSWAPMGSGEICKKFSGLLRSLEISRRETCHVFPLRMSGGGNFDGFPAPATLECWSEFWLVIWSISIICW